MEFEPVIGLEIHIQLNTNTKIFCGCSTKFGEMPNSQTCPVCLGLPGVLPVLNEEALKKGILAGLAVNSKISKFSKFDRKNYFYPDLPKAYQISQFDKPICEGGYVDVKVDDKIKRLNITRIHLEEDAGKSMHSEIPGENKSFIDLNRTGVPLAEIVSEPDMRTADEAYEYVQTIRKIMRYINVSDCNMEEGSLRCDVNISVREKGVEKFGEKVEIKNLNSIKSIKASINYEIERQIDLIESGEKSAIVQETRLYDAENNVTYSMRSKEDAHDYRYFPDPDLAPIVLDDKYIDDLKKTLPELPEAKKERFLNELKLPEYDAGVLTSTRQLAEYFETVIENGIDPKKASNWVMGEVLARAGDVDEIDSFIVTPSMLAKLIGLIDDNTISGKIAKAVFKDMVESGKDPLSIVEEKGLKQVTDTGEIETIINKVLDENQSSIDDYKNGKTKALGFLVGQVMKASRGKANPKIVNELLLKKLK